jgi:hypothetical protein
VPFLTSLDGHLAGTYAQGVLLLLLIVAVVAASRSPWVARLDQRLLGVRGVAGISVVAAALLLAATVASAAQGVWAIAAVYAFMTSWVGYWAARRVQGLRAE